MSRLRRTALRLLARSRRGLAPSGRGPSGFTLIEMLAVILLTSIVMAAALNHYVNLSRVSQRATERTAEVRRATAILDRVSRDLQAAILHARPPGDEALAHPWIFFGEPEHSEEGADRLRFMTRGRTPRAGTGPQSDFEVVAYSLRHGDEDDSYELMRWSSPTMPEGPERETPSDESDGAQLLAEGLADFAVNFVDGFGEASASWDSALLEDSSNLPIAVDVEVALFDARDPEGEPVRFKRRVVLPVEPLDMEELTDPTAAVSGAPPEGEQEEEEFLEVDRDNPNVSPECADSPCAGRNACAVIQCEQRLGTGTTSDDAIYNSLLNSPREFCAWYGQARSGGTSRRLTPNPECQF